MLSRFLGAGYYKVTLQARFSSYFLTLKWQLGTDEQAFGQNIYIFFFHEQVYVSEKARNDIDFLNIIIYLPPTSDIPGARK